MKSGTALLKQTAHTRARRRKSGLIGTVTLGSIDSVPYEALDVDTLMNDVFVKIHETDFSQFVISDSGLIVGSITDRKAFGALSEFGDEVKDHQVGEYMDDPFPVLSVNTPGVKASAFTSNVSGGLNKGERRSDRNSNQQ